MADCTKKSTDFCTVSLKKMKERYKALTFVSNCCILGLSQEMFPRRVLCTFMGTGHAAAEKLRRAAWYRFLLFIALLYQTGTTCDIYI
ncbi:hypothetical protein RUMCAL_01493 [Ruminococcus callidus ATCC 27760]|uniref:Uncharacterized protein n=1 Tax=Ruminococcus callidus ATCC 27760 TaxID=411473 RepID=U2M328_9FIRM|nr:hypothetical protein RUMCAL_01493 [Ruminococcus callidus ATCC 27760]